MKLMNFKMVRIADFKDPVPFVAVMDGLPNSLISSCPIESRFSWGVHLHFLAGGFGRAIQWVRLGPNGRVESKGFDTTQ